MFRDSARERKSAARYAHPALDTTREPGFEPRMAARCRYLRVTMGERAGGHLLNICQHIIREGRECVGPFLDDHETSCGIWEPKELEARESEARA